MKSYLFHSMLICQQEGTVVSIYSDKTAPDVFRVGIILDCNIKRIILFCLDEDGELSGIKLIPTDSVYCIQYNDMYTKSIQEKWNKEITIPTSIFQKRSDALEALLAHIGEKKKIVSFELQNSGTWDVSGIISMIEDDTVVLNALCDDGDDGICVLSFNAITEIFVDGHSRDDSTIGVPDDSTVE